MRRHTLKPSHYRLKGELSSVHSSSAHYRRAKATFPPREIERERATCSANKCLPYAKTHKTIYRPWMSHFQIMTVHLHWSYLPAPSHLGNAQVKYGCTLGVYGRPGFAGKYHKAAMQRSGERGLVPNMTLMCLQDPTSYFRISFLFAMHEARYPSQIFVSFSQPERSRGYRIHAIHCL